MTCTIVFTAKDSVAKRTAPVLMDENNLRLAIFVITDDAATAS